MPFVIEYLQAQKWPSVACEIIQSKVISGKSGYNAEIRYRYHYDNKIYEGNRYNLFSINSDILSYYEKIVKTYPVGSKVYCYVNPKNPEKSVLERKSEIAYLFPTLFPCLIIWAGIYGVSRKELERRKNEKAARTIGK